MGTPTMLQKFQTSLTSFDIYDVLGESFSSKTTLQNENKLKWSLNWMKLGMLSSFHQQCMLLNLKVVMIKTNGTPCTKLYHSLQSIGVSTGNTCITSTTYYL